MKYKYEITQENGDATADYNLRGPFPVKFAEFFKEILEAEDSFRIEFRSHGDWSDRVLEVSKDTATGKCYWVKREPENWFDIVRDLNVKSCWANGGYGQMTYFVDFDTEISGARADCPMRHVNGNCLPVGGFCAGVSDIICEVAHQAYEHGWHDRVAQRAQEKEIDLWT